MYEALFLKSKIVAVGLCAIIVIFGFSMAPNRSRFLLAVGTVSAAFQIDILIAPLGAVLVFSNFVFAILFAHSFFEIRSLQGVRDRSTPRIIWPWLGVIFFAALAIFKAINPVTARAPLLLFSFNLITFFAVLRTVKTASDVRFFVGCLLAALIVQGMIGLLQYKFPFFKIGVIDHSQSWMWWRAKGTFFHANHFGMFLALMLPIAIRSMVNAMAQGDSKWITYSFVAIGVGFVALLASYNRGSMVGFTFGLMIMLSIDFTRRGVKIRRIVSNLIAVGFLCVGLLSIKFGSKVYDRFFHSDANDQIEGRESQMAEALQVVSQHPVIGVGYSNDRYYAAEAFVHNMYLLIATETGIPGLLFFLWVIAEALRTLWRMSRSSVLYCSNYARGAIAAILGFCLASWAGPDFWIDNGVRSYFWLIVALVFVLSRLNRVVLLKQNERYALQRQQAGAASSIAAQATGVL
jgi:O-antigen ligase